MTSGDTFFDFINDFLSFTDNEEQRLALTSEKYDEYWIDAFSPGSEKYAKLKYLGIDDFKAGFKQYICQYFPNETEHFLTTINNTYTAVKNLRKMSINLGFGDYTQEDTDYVLESVFGVLAILGRELYLSDREKYLHPQELYISFFRSYFEKYPIDVMNGEYVWITELSNYWKFFTKTTFNPKKNKETGFLEILTDDFYNGVSEYNPDIVKELKELRFSDEIDIDDWAKEIMEVLISYGFTRQWLKDNTKNILFDDDPTIVQIARKNNYDRFILESRFDSDVKYYRLVGQWVDEKGRHREDIIKILPMSKDVKYQARKILVELK
jgi:hypothetical protein